MLQVPKALIIYRRSEVDHPCLLGHASAFTTPPSSWAHSTYLIVVNPASDRNSSVAIIIFATKIKDSLE